MPRKRHKPEEIVAKLRQVDVLTSQGQSVPDAIRSIGVSEVTYYRWRQEYGGLKSDQVKRLKDLETENGRLRRGDLRPDARQADPARGCQRETSKPRAPPCLHRANVSFTYPSAAPVRRSASIARRSARYRGALKTRSG